MIFVIDCIPEGTPATYGVIDGEDFFVHLEKIRFDSLGEFKEFVECVIRDEQAVLMVYYPPVVKDAVFITIGFHFPGNSEDIEGMPEIEKPWVPDNIKKAFEKLAYRIN